MCKDSLGGVITVDSKWGEDHLHFDAIQSVLRQPDGGGDLQARVQCGPSHYVYTGIEAAQFMRQYNQILKDRRV